MDGATRCASRFLPQQAHLQQPCLDVLAITEGAALAPQEQLVEQLHVHKAEQLSEQRLRIQGRGKARTQGRSLHSA